MDSKGMLRLGCLLVGFAGSGGTLGCSKTATIAPASPAVAFGAARSDVEAGCSFDGMPRVVATHLIPKAGVTASVGTGRVWLRFATTHDPRMLVAIDPETLDVVTDATPPVETAPEVTRGPVVVNLQDHRRLMAWTEGSLDDGLHVRAVTVGDEGNAMGEPIDLGFEGSVVGRPAVAFTENGKGVLAFVESNDVGFQLVVTHADCTSF